MNARKWFSGICAFALVALAVGCGGNITTPVVQTQSGTVFVSGGDAPLPSVVSFKVDISGISVAQGPERPLREIGGAVFLFGQPSPLRVTQLPN